jgi:hypothetical protein
MVFMAGRLQRVETVDDSSDDESGPPPLEDIEGSAGNVAVKQIDVDSDEEPPDLLSQSQSGSSDEEEEEEDDGSEAPPLGDTEQEEGDGSDSDPPAGSEGDDIPSLTGGSEEEESEESATSDDELPPDLDDPDVSIVLDHILKAMRYGQRLQPLCSKQQRMQQQQHWRLLSAPAVHQCTACLLPLHQALTLAFICCHAALVC